MEWREKLMLAVFPLALVACALEIYAVWSVLVAHLTANNWFALVLIHLAVLGSLINFYVRTVKGTPRRQEAISTAAFVVLSWAYDFSLMGKIGGHW